jgi:hypothetical protein
MEGHHSIWARFGLSLQGEQLPCKAMRTFRASLQFGMLGQSSYQE